MSSPDEISQICEEYFKAAASAIKRDDLDLLKDVLDVLPEFNTMTDGLGCNLLHLSCESKNKKVFDYLLNLNCFDLEAVDGDQQTALLKAISSSHGCDYFSMKLISAGVDVLKICPHERTYLHHAMSYYLFETGELLLQKGVDPNAQDFSGRTALYTLMNVGKTHKVDECVDLLLQYGADTAIYNKDGYLPFDFAVINEMQLHIQEHVFYCTFDSHSVGYKISSRVFNRLLDAPNYRNVSPLLENVMDVLSDVIFEEYFEVNFFTIPLDLLKKFIERCGYIIRRTFSFIKPDHIKKMNINNVEILINSELHFETIELISKLELWIIYSHNYSKEGKENASSLILYLLSYGLNVTSYDCEYVYESQHYSDLFKTMLLLDYAHTSLIDCPMTEIILDIHCDLNTILARFDGFSCYEIELLLDYFDDPELRRLCERSHEPDLVNKVRRLPKVPSLLQLARDETRRHIVGRYNLQKTSQYYWVLRRLLGGTDYAEILSFETKLYR